MPSGKLAKKPPLHHIYLYIIEIVLVFRFMWCCRAVAQWAWHQVAHPHSPHPSPLLWAAWGGRGATVAGSGSVQHVQPRRNRQTAMRPLPRPLQYDKGPLWRPNNLDLCELWLSALLSRSQLPSASATPTTSTRHIARFLAAPRVP